MGDQKYTRDDVSGRNGKNGAPLWIIVKDVVYDVSSYLREHPGGDDALLEQAGKDATKDFEAVGHSGDARAIMKKYRVGEIVEKKKKEADKDPVKPTNKLLPPKKPAAAGPPPSKPKHPPTGLQSGKTSISTPPDMPTRDLLEAPTDPLVVIATEVTVANTTSLSSTDFVSGEIICGSTIASIKLASETSSGLVTVSSDQSGETISSNNVPNQTAVPENVQEDVSLNSKLTDSDPKAVGVSSTNIAPSTSSSTTNPTSATSSKSSPTVLQGLSKVTLSSSKPAAKQAQLPWSSFSQPAKQKTPSSFSGSTNNPSSKAKQHDPFKNKMAGGMKKK